MFPPQLSRPFYIVILLTAVFLEVGSAQLFAQQPERILYIRGEFSDSAMPISESVWSQRLTDINAFGQTYYQRDSYGTISEFQGTLTPVFRLPEASTGYQGGSNVHKLNSHMRSLASNAGFNLSQYDQVVLSYPGVLNQPFGAAALPGTVWLPGSNPWGPGFVHEMGHAFGVGHASSIEAGDQVFPGEHREGRDGLHMLGSEDGRLAPTNLYMKLRMGFVGNEYFQTATENGVHRIYAYDEATLPNSSDNKLGTFFNVDGLQFLVSYGPGMAEIWDDFGGEVWSRGVMVHQTLNSITRLLDFTPGSQGEGNTEDYWDTRDGALTLGNTFQFPNSDFLIQPLETGTGVDGRRYINVRFQLTPIPEPGHAVGLAALSLALIGRRRRL